jgi:NIMA (never in mitosis gene a)-related kinase
MENYEKIRVLGRGSFGSAWLLKRKKDEVLFVLKEIELENLDVDEMTDALNEIKILSAVNHPNIIKMHEHFQTSDYLCIIMDYCEGGDLASVIKAMRGVPIFERQILDWFLQICLAVKHLHERHILHRDLKAQNVFLTRKRRVIKLGDFGIAKILDPRVLFAKTSVGSLYFFFFFF